MNLTLHEYNVHLQKVYLMIKATVEELERVRLIVLENE